MFWQRRNYLDWASAAPVSGAALRAYARASQAFGNPSSPHEEGRAASAILEKARTDIARLVECKPDDVIITSGATEANNLAIRGLVRPGSHVLYHPGAHASVVESVRSLEGVLAEPVPIVEGKIDIEALQKMIRPATALVTLEAVCGETGTIWETHKVKTALPAHVALHVDASQAPLTQKITRAHFGADLMTLDAQKVGGMRGAGVLIAPRILKLSSIMFGGGQERGLRSGTPSPALAAAFAAALTLTAKGRETFARTAKKAKEALSTRIVKEISEVYINEGAESAPNILNLSLLGRDTDYLVALLDKAGIAVSTRSACETDSETGSRAVFALTLDPERAKSTLRISWGGGVSERKLLECADALIREVAFLDKANSKSHY